jgi:hypothetical protein
MIDNIKVNGVPFSQASSLKMDKAVLEAVRYTTKLTMDTFAMPPYFEVSEYMGRQLSIEMIQRVATQKLEEHTQEQVIKEVSLESEPIYVPKTWWQYFKLTYFPKGLLKKFPVKYEERKSIAKGVVTFIVNWTLTADVFYPKIAIPEDIRYIHVNKPSFEVLKPIIEEDWYRKGNE